jgi:EmrB/QacA subfamily drug resistance transporter
MGQSQPNTISVTKERLKRRFTGLMVPFIVGCALFMQMLDATVIAIALPAIASDFAVPVIQLNLAITAYLLAAAVFVPISGWAADRWGARRVFIAAIVIFTLSSAGCALAMSTNQLVGWRLIQGIGGAMMVPVGRLILLRTTAKHDLLRAMAFLSMPALLGPMLGPPLGGVLVTYASWHWIFLINLPIGLLGIYMSLKYIGSQSNQVTKRPLDGIGFLLSATCLASLVGAFEMLGQGRLGWEWVVTMLATGFVTGWLYKWHSGRCDSPIIDLRLMRIATFRESVIGGNLCRFAVSATPFLLALLLQIGFGMSPLSAGLITFASAAGALLMKFAAPPILKRWGYRQVLIINASLTAGTLALCATFSDQTPVALMIAVLLIGGFFRSLQFTAVNTLGFADITADRMSAATGFSAMAQQLGMSLGVGIAASAINLSMTVRGANVLGVPDMITGFVVISLCCALSVLSFRRLPPGAGASLQHK